jgi:alkylation response protein AidB-like acyl-CoA dehydrogenase
MGMEIAYAHARTALRVLRRRKEDLGLRPIRDMPEVPDRFASMICTLVASNFAFGIDC